MLIGLYIVFTLVLAGKSLRPIPSVTTCETCGGAVKVMPKAFAVLTGQALADTSDRSIEDPVVIPTALAAAKALASLMGWAPLMGWAQLTGQALKQRLAHLQRKAESKEFNLLPESRAPPQEDLFG